MHYVSKYIIFVFLSIIICHAMYAYTYTCKSLKPGNNKYTPEAFISKRIAEGHCFCEKF